MGLNRQRNSHRERAPLSCEAMDDVLAEDRLAVDIASFLQGCDVLRLAQASSRWHRLLLNPSHAADASCCSSSARWLWDGILERELGRERMELYRRPSRIRGHSAPDGEGGPKDVAALVHAYATARVSSGAKEVRWRQLVLRHGGHTHTDAHGHTDTHTPHTSVYRECTARAMEGHSATLVGGRYVVMVGGFGRGIHNEVYVMDADGWVGWVQARVMSGSQLPRPKYGHACVALPAAVDTRTHTHTHHTHTHTHPGGTQPSHTHAHSVACVGMRQATYTPRTRTHSAADTSQRAHAGTQHTHAHVAHTRVYTLAVFGGVVYGGYQGSVNDLHFLDVYVEVCVAEGEDGGGAGVRVGGHTGALEQGGGGGGGGSSSSSSGSRHRSSTAAVASSNHAGSQGRTSRGNAGRGRASSVEAELRWPFTCSASWRQPKTEGIRPTSRGYASMTLAGPRILVLGGIHQGTSCDVLEVLEMSDSGLTWTRPVADGEAPAARMGHSGVFIPNDIHEAAVKGYGNVIVAGGSDGSDLLRDGHDLQDVHVLSLEPDGQGVRYTWSQPTFCNSAGPRSLGRTHTAHYLGDGRVLYFGGSANLSNTLALLHTSPPHAHTLAPGQQHQRVLNFGGSASLSNTLALVHTSMAHAHTVAPGQQHDTGSSYERWAWTTPLLQSSTRPIPRISHVSVHTGAHVLVYGGWHGGEMSDMWLCSLAPNLTLSANISNSATSRPYTPPNSSNNILHSSSHTSLSCSSVRGTALDGCSDAIGSGGETFGLADSDTAAHEADGDEDHGFVPRWCEASNDEDDGVDGGSDDHHDEDTANMYGQGGVVCAQS